jgi:hypothetical protein
MPLHLLIAAVTLAGAVALWLRTPAGWPQVRVLGRYAALMLVLLTASGWPRHYGWLPAALPLAAAAACALAPAILSYLLPLALISQGPYGFVIARTVAWESYPARYGLLSVGYYSKLTYLVLPVAYGLLGAGGWLLWTALPEHPGLARRLLGPRLDDARDGTGPRGALWGLLLCRS